MFICSFHLLLKSSLFKCVRAVIPDLETQAPMSLFTSFFFNLNSKNEWSVNFKWNVHQSTSRNISAWSKRWTCDYGTSCWTEPAVRLEPTINWRLRDSCASGRHQTRFCSFRANVPPVSLALPVPRQIRCLAVLFRRTAYQQGSPRPQPSASPGLPVAGSQELAKFPATRYIIFKLFEFDLLITNLILINKLMNFWTKFYQ